MTSRLALRLAILRGFSFPFNESSDDFFFPHIIAPETCAVL